MESFPLISTSEKYDPLTPSTLSRKGESGFLNLIEEITIPFLFLLKTCNLAVGVLRSVKIVPKLTVSVEKVRDADGESVISSLMQEETVNPKITEKIRNIFLKAFIKKKR